jgi:LacI family transcriptional regulator
MRGEKYTGRAGIKQIADALGISIGTVDRALHERPGVSAKTRERVLRMARKLNYTPNVAARNLKLNRHLRIGVFLPQQIASFFDPLREGIQAAQSAAAMNVEVVFHQYPRLGRGDAEALEAHDWRQFDGMIIAPGNPARLATICQQARDKNKPVVFVATDAPGVHRLASVSVEATISGGIAAELLGQLIRLPGQVVVITGDLNIQDHADKLRGFAASLATLSPHLSMLPAIQSHESPKEAHAATLRLLKEHPSLRGIYINTANSAGVIGALAESQQPGNIKVIATDFFPAMAGWIDSGQVFATLHQRPFTQGRMAFESLSRYLALGTVPARSASLMPHLVLRSNLSLFSDGYTAGEQEPES